MATPEGDALIHLRVPPPLKARWVRKSREAGLKLTDWIVQSVGRPANKTTPTPCPRCSSTVLVSDGPYWQCAQCGLVA